MFQTTSQIVTIVLDASPSGTSTRFCPLALHQLPQAKYSRSVPDQVWEADPSCRMDGAKVLTKGTLTF